MLLPKEADFPLLITLPQPSIKLSFNCPLSQHKGRGRIPARCFNGLVLDPGRKDFINPKGWIWGLSLVFQRFHCHPSCFPSIPGRFLHPSNDPSSREEREAQGHSLPLVFDGDQNCKSAFWLLAAVSQPQPQLQRQQREHVATNTFTGIDFHIPAQQ